MPDPFTLITALALGAIGTMAAAAKDGEDNEPEVDASSSPYGEPCDWSYDSNDYGSSSGDHQTTLSDFD